VIRFRVDDHIIRQSIDLLGTLFFDVFPVRVDSHGSTGLWFMSPLFLCNFFPFFNNVYEQLTID
jgi:hypothetical protein